MLVEAGIVITLSELEVIVLEFLKKGIQYNENIHKYVQYLSFAKGYSLPSEVWKKYLDEILIYASKIFNNKLPKSENLEIAMDCAMNMFTDVYSNTCFSNGVEQVTPEFKKILQITFASLETFTNNVKSVAEKTQKRTSVVRPFLLCILKNNISLTELFKNEFYTQFFVGELVNWGLESPDFFQALFTKICKEGFSAGKIPWSVYKGVKDELHHTENKDLYFFVTKYFFDNYEDQEEVCSYVFTIPEYKELIKYFLSNKEDLNDDLIEMNENNEAEYDGFLIV